MVPRKDLSPILERARVLNRLRYLRNKILEIELSGPLTEENEDTVVALQKDISDIKKKYIFLIIDNTCE